MQFRSITILFTLLLFSGCMQSPDVPLTKQLSTYTQAQQQCLNVVQGDSRLTGEVEKECGKFLKRLEQSNNLGIELESKKLTKPEYAIKETEDARQRLKLKLQYGELCESVNKATLAAIKRDDVEAFSEGINFPGNSFITPYYDYMKKKAPRFNNDPHFLAYQRQESERLMQEARQNLDLGRELKARELYEAAAAMNNPEAARNVALLYENSDIDKALQWHLIAANGGVQSSYLSIARLYEAQEKQEEALKWYLRAAESGDAKAQYRLYNYYRSKDNKQALTWLQKSVRNEYPQAQYSYALILMEDKKSKKALELMQKASENNYQQASDYLGQYYYDVKLYDNALLQLSKSESANAFYLRARMAEQGLGSQQDYSAAYSFYTHAYDLGKEDASADAKRVQKLQSKEQQRIADEEKKKRAKLMAKMTKECGEVPSMKNIKKSGQLIHLTGTTSVPVSGPHNFILFGDDGESYYLINAKGIGENAHIDIAAKAVGRVISLSYADDEARDIYQFTYVKPCVLAEEEQ